MRYSGCLNPTNSWAFLLVTFIILGIHCDESLAFLQLSNNNSNRGGRKSVTYQKKGPAAFTLSSSSRKGDIFNHGCILIKRNNVLSNHFFFSSRFSHKLSLTQDDTLALLTADENDIKKQEKEPQQKHETLKFGGKLSYKSQMYTSTTVNDIIELTYNFFEQETTQNLLLSGGKNSTIDAIHSDDLHPELIMKWNDEVKALKASKPDIKQDRVVKVTPQSIELVTVCVIPTVTIGTKLIKVEKTLNNGNTIILPEFEAILILDEPRAEGPKFFVWLFNKITYGGDPDKLSDNDSRTSKRRERALLRIRTELVEAEEFQLEQKLIFIADSSMTLEFEFPKMLLRFFPMKKEKAEQLCSNAITKALEENLLPAMKAFGDEYELFLSSKRS